MKIGTQQYNDKLSDLPDSILLHILSFLNTKEAFQTCVLSKRWNHLPKQLPSLHLSSDHFESLYSFNNLVSRVVSLRDHSTALHTLDFMDHDDFVEPDILKSIVEYAVSHNVQLLRITISCDIQQFPSSLFSSQTLTSLHLSVHPRIQHRKILFPNSLNFPALTTLALSCFYFGADDDGCVEPFSAFTKLNTLIVERCQLLDAESLCISSTTLVNLTIHGYGYYNYFPDDGFKFKLSTPSLCSSAFHGTLNRNLCRKHLCSVKHLYIDVVIRYNSPIEEDSVVLLKWLQELANIKSLTISSNTLQVLSFVPDLSNVKLTSLCTLESLQVKMELLSYSLYMKLKSFKTEKEGTEFYLGQHTSVPDGVVEFLLQNSPSAKLKPEPRAHKNIKA